MPAVPARNPPRRRAKSAVPEEATRSPLTRESWIDAATEVLVDQGIDHVRVDVLAGQLQVTRGSFYWHFRDREDLLRAVLQRWRPLAWLGLLGDDPLPAGAHAPIEILTARMLERMSYAPGERDLLVLRHEFRAEFPDREARITSTMVDFGIPGGDSSMSRTVGLPAAIGVKLILQGKIRLTGVQTPVVPEIYEPVLTELEELGLRFDERWETA